MNGPRTWVLLSLLWVLVFGMLMPGAVDSGYVTTIRGVSDSAQRTKRTHDFSNRLTSVTPPAGPAQTLVYDHAGNLIQRTTGAGNPNERRRIYYDDAWRMIQEDVSSWNSGTPGWNAPHTQVNWYWGLRGTNDIVQRTERDLTQSGDPIAKQWWYVTDLDSSVVATVSQTGMIVERVSYSPFGEVRHHPLGDLNGDGAVNNAK